MWGSCIIVAKLGISLKFELVPQVRIDEETLKYLTIDGQTVQIKKDNKINSF